MGVIKKMLTDVWRVDDNIDIVFRKLGSWTDTTKQQELGSLEDSLRQDNFTLGV